MQNGAIKVNSAVLKNQKETVRRFKAHLELLEKIHNFDVKIEAANSVVMANQSRMLSATLKSKDPKHSGDLYLVMLDVFPLMPTLLKADDEREKLRKEQKKLQPKLVESEAKLMSCLGVEKVNDK